MYGALLSAPSLLIDCNSGLVAVLRVPKGVTEAVAREGMRLAADKLPIRTKFISRHAIG